MTMRVLKLGGSQLDRPELVEELAAALHDLDRPPILVHGGGPAVDELQARLGMKPVKVEGLRRSQPQELEAAIMALCGLVNKRLVAGLLAAGLPAVGLAGLDSGLLRVKKVEHSAADLGFVGQIVEVHPALLANLIAGGFTPVVAPISLGLDGQIYNVNADQVASALAEAVGARSLELISDVPGVVVDGAPIASLNPGQARALLESGRVNGGMVPKVAAALEAIEAGVPWARVVDLAGLASGGGTTFTLEESSEPREKGKRSR